MRLAPAHLALAAVLLLAGCAASGALIDPDDVDGDDTAVDTEDTEEQEGPYWAGSWTGTAVLAFTEWTDDPFCTGTVDMEITPGGTLTGSGPCVVSAGPAGGSSFTLELAATVGDEGEVTGHVTVSDWELMGDPPSAEFGGSVGADTMGLGWIFAIPDPMGGTAEVEGTIEGTRPVE